MSATVSKNLTAKDLKRDHAALYAQLRLSFMAIGAEAERARIKAVLAQALPGDEELVHQLAFDGITTGLEAARLSLKSRLKADHRASKTNAARAPALPIEITRVDAAKESSHAVFCQTSSAEDAADTPGAPTGQGNAA